MKKIVLQRLYLIIRWVIGLVFIYAGGSKLIDTGAFSEVVSAYGLIPENIVPLFAVLLPLVEILAGIGLVSDLRGSLFVISFMLFLFIGVLAYAVHLGFDIDCGCFSPGDPEAKAFHGLKAAIVKDIIMMGGVVYLYLWRIKTSHTPKNILRII